MADDDKPDTYTIDILQMEIDEKLPHWLSWPQKHPEEAAAIRKKHRDRWLAEQKAKRPKAKAYKSDDDPILDTEDSELTEVELWPDRKEDYDGWMDRCITELIPCIGADRAVEVCDSKWNTSEELGKKGVVDYHKLSGDLTVQPCGKACIACEGAPAPFEGRISREEVEREWDESKHPRVPGGEHGGEFTSSGGDDELGSMALGGADRNITASTKKVDALREEMGVDEDDIPVGQRQALDMYTQDSNSFNAGARQGGRPDAATENLDQLIAGHMLPSDVTVYRTVGWQRTQNILSNEGSFSDPAFMSTTLDKSKIDKPGSYIEIQVPKGSKAFPVGSLSNYPEEAEILFPRDSRLQIISHEPRDAPNTVHFVARLVS